MCVRSSGVIILAWVLLSHLATASLAADHVSKASASAQTIQKLRELGVRIETDLEVADFGHLTHRLAGKGVHIEIDPKGNVVDLRLRGPWVNDDTLKRIGQLSTLQGLCLGRSSTTDAGLQHLRYLSQLKRLGLWRTQVTDEGMKYVAELANLEKLDLSLTVVGDRGLEHLKQLKSLRWLNLKHGRGITARGLRHLASMPNLRYLDVRTHKQRFPEGGFAALRGCRLERLRLFGYVREDQIDNLAGLTRLKQLPSLSIMPDILRRLKSLKQLENLTISTSFLASEGAEVLLEFPNLRDVYVRNGRGGKFGVREASILGKLPRLESLNLRELIFSNESLAGLTDTPSLRELDLANTQLNDAGAVHLGRIATLRVLNLASTQLSDAGLAHIGRLTDLESFNVNRTKVTENGLKHLEGMTKLTFFLPTHSISYDAAEAFQQYVPNCRIGDAWCCGCLEIEPLAKRQLRRGKISVQE